MWLEAWCLGQELDPSVSKYAAISPKDVTTRQKKSGRIAAYYKNSNCRHEKGELPFEKPVSKIAIRVGERCTNFCAAFRRSRKDCDFLSEVFEPYKVTRKVPFPKIEVQIFDESKFLINLT